MKQTNEKDRHKRQRLSPHDLDVLGTVISFTILGGILGAGFGYLIYFTEVSWYKVVLPMALVGLVILLFHRMTR